MQEESNAASKFSLLEEMGFERAEVDRDTPESTPVGDGRHKVECRRAAMGTLVTVIGLGNSLNQLEEALGRAFDEMDRLIALLSRYDDSSAVSYLNSRGKMSELPRELSRLLSRSLQFHELSNGAFDISVEPIVDLFRERMQRSIPAEPSGSEIAEALELVGSRYIDLTSSGVELKRSGMSVSLNGIAKGYIVDAIARVLAHHGVEDWLINAGGDVRASGKKESDAAWSVAVQDPAKRDHYPDTIELQNAAVATAGSYEKHFDPAERFHHIINCDTGLSPQLNLSVSILAPSTMIADALATSVYVMEPRLGASFIEGIKGCECLIVDRSGRTIRSSGWRSASPRNPHEAEL